ncbi:hypothetical protein [Neobacillus jeddahensis]|nr:hypothetical protein [Neobacillus jeddahensis]
MKSLLLAILGAIVAWLVIGFISKDFETHTLYAVVIGIIVGNTIGKRQK